jgi:SNF2 family DNA or RNA helicase
MADPTFKIRLLADGNVRLCVNDHPAAWARTRLIVTEQTEQAQLIGADCLEVPWWELAPIFSQLGSIQRLFPEVRIDADNETRGLINRSRNASEQIAQTGEIVPVSPESLKAVFREVKFMRELTDQQLRNVGKLAALSNGATFSVPGAGKTTEAFATFAFKSKLKCNLLVVCPKNAFSAWEEQTKACLPQLFATRLTGGYSAIKELLKKDPRLVLITYSQLTNVRDLIAQYFTRTPAVMFLDESHKIKGGEHRPWASAVLSLSHMPEWKLIMSGTPMPNALEDLMPQIRFLYAGIGSGEDPVPIIQKIHVRTTKAELDLPPVSCTGVPIPMTDSQARLYGLCAYEVARDAESVIKSGDKNALRNFGKSYMLLLQLVSNPALLAAYQGRFNSRDHIECLQSDSPKLAYVCHRARQLVAQGNKVLIWSSFVQNVEIISERLSDLGADYIHGDVEAGSEEEEQTREFKIARFHRQKNDAMVLVANPAACGEGISLHQVCHHAIYVDRNYNAAQFLQSQDRIHRYGLPKETKTFIEYIYCPNTIDESVNRRLQAKVDRMQEVLQDTSINMPTHWLDDLDELPDGEDIRDLLETLRGNVA